MPGDTMIASVMAKKTAVDADLVVIDIPVGRNTKVEDVQDGRKLAREFIDIGERLGMRVECALSYGESPSATPSARTWRCARRSRPGGCNRTELPDPEERLPWPEWRSTMAGKPHPARVLEVAADVLRSGKALGKMRQI